MLWILPSLLVFFITIFQQTCALELKEIPPSSIYSKRNRRNGDYTELDLRSSETFLWGGPSHGDLVLGNITVYMPGDTENILSMERFAGMLSSVECTQTNMTLGFHNDETFAYAQRVWDWVNGVDNHSFVMVAGANECGWNEYRQPFVVSNIAYDEVANVAYLNAVAHDWQEIAHSYDIHIGQVPTPEDTMTKRWGGNEDVSISVQKDFPWSVKESFDGWSISAGCDGCKIEGSFDFEFGISVKHLVVLKSAYAKISPRGITAKFPLQVAIAANFTDKKDIPGKEFSIPLEGITLMNVVKIGPFLNVQPGIQLGPVAGSASVSSGLEFTIPDASVASLDLFNGQNTKTSGWNATIKTLPFNVDATLSAEIQGYVKVSIDLEASAFDHGFQVGVGLKPYASLKTEVMFATQGVCENDKEHHQIGVTANPKLGVDLFARAALVDKPEKPIWEGTLAGPSLDLLKDALCFAFGPTDSRASGNATTLAASNATDSVASAIDA